LGDCCESVSISTCGRNHGCFGLVAQKVRRFQSREA
jgi:hypothetical protein